MKTAAYHILRVGTAITFLWIGILILKDLDTWRSLIQPWAKNLMPLPIKHVMITTAILDLVVGFLLLIDTWVWLAALVGALHIFSVFIVVGINEITVRDIGLLAATLALVLMQLPQNIIDALPLEKNRPQKNAR
jgi:uncharacterized membrane protein YphA (DoxX/SURF4 family)